MKEVFVILLMQYIIMIFFIAEDVHEMKDTRFDDNWRLNIRRNSLHFKSKFEIFLALIPFFGFLTFIKKPKFEGLNNWWNKFEDD